MWSKIVGEIFLGAQKFIFYQRKVEAKTSTAGSPPRNYNNKINPDLWLFIS